MQTEMDRRTTAAIADTMRRLGDGCTEKTLQLYHSRDDLIRLGDTAREKAMIDQERSVRVGVSALRAA